MDRKTASVIDVIVASDICCGCGTCVAVCPTKSLSMTLSPDGEFQPRLTGRCTQCGVCLGVCPFYENDKDAMSRRLYETLPRSQYLEALGYYVGTHVGWTMDESQRARSASGGVLTALLVDLVQSKEVDAVAVVDASPGDEVEFRTRLARTPEEVRSAASSKYFPTEFAGPLNEVLAHEGRYAVVMLPCQVYGLRRAQERLPVLKERIKYVFGLVCNHNVGVNFLQCLRRYCNVRPGELERVNFRDKQSTFLAGWFFLSFSQSDDPRGNRSEVCFNGPYGDLFQSYAFTLNSCHHCDDVYAELADAVFMDAWLPQWSSNPLGTSIIVTRLPAVDDHLTRLRDAGRLHLEPISPQEVLRSQQGVIRYKREWILDRQRQRIAGGLHCPPARVLSGCVSGRRHSGSSGFRMWMSHFSKAVWRRSWSQRLLGVRPLLGIAWLWRRVTGMVARMRAGVARLVGRARRNHA